MESRQPAFLGNTWDYNIHFGGAEHLFGNVPAIDLLRLEDNEGAAYDKDLKVLCGASGDLRNVVKTIASLPTTYQQPVCFTINDINLSIVARNFAIAFIALSSKDRQIDETIDTMIHVWYSAFLRQRDVVILRSQIRPTLQDICNKIQSKSPTAVVGKTWTFGSHSLRHILTKRAWTDLLSFFDVNESPTLGRVMQARQAVTKILRGWTCAAVWLSSLDLTLKFLNVDAVDLDQHPEVIKERFARIETSNIADGGYLGVKRTLTSLHSLLQTPTENPHATMMTLFMNAALEMFSEDSWDEAAMRKEMKSVKPYLPAPPLNSTSLQQVWYVQANAVLGMVAGQNFRDNESLFRRYMDIYSFNTISQAVGLTMKKRHTIVEEWPLGLKLRHGQEGAKEEFNVVISSGHTGAERYVEWVFVTS